MTDKQSIKANSIIEDLIFLKSILKKNNCLSYDEFRYYADIINKVCNEIEDLVREKEENEE